MTATKDGKLWVATMSGAAMLDLAKLPPAAGRPFEYVSEIEVDRKKRNAGRELILAPGLHHTEIQLGSIELSSPERAHIQYRLEGIDSEWLDAKPDGIAVYTTIPHGTYLFHVRASNGGGIWDRQGIVYQITQEPFFYETSTFRILMIVVGCILLTVAYRSRLRQEADRIKVRLEERVAERERVARDLHDTLLQSFHGLMLHFQVVHRLLPEGNAKEQIEETLERADRAIAEGRSTVCDLRSSALAANDLSEALREVGNDLSNENTATFGLVVEGPTMELQPIIRDEFYRISREALRNAFTHAGARHVEAEISYGERLFRLRIRDDGEGIPAEILEHGRPGHYGLPGIRERAKQAGADLRIWSRAGAGTEIELSLAGSIAYGGTSPRQPRFRLFRNKVGSA